MILDEEQRLKELGNPEAWAEVPRPTE